MQTVTINFTVSGQTLNVTNLPIKIASNTVKYVKAVFALDSDWTGFDVVSAIWYNDFAQIAVVLDENGECMIPHEVLAKPDDVMVNLVGRDIVNDELVDRLTTYPEKALDVDANAKITGTETAPVTPSQFEQYIAIVEQLVGSVKDIDHTELNADYTLTIYYTDGTSDTVGPIRGAQGATGNGILSAVLNPDYTLTLNYTNGQHDTVGPIRGAQGETGNGIQSIYLTGTSGAVKTYTILFTDGNTTEFQVTDGEVTNAVLEFLMPTDTASGAIASFPDGQNVFPLKSLTAEINPIQDLHGYDSPWVGGGGVNKFDAVTVSYLSNFSRNDITFTNTDTDTSANFLLAVQCYSGTTFLGQAFAQQITSLGVFSRTFTPSAGTDKIRIKHNGSARDFIIDAPFSLAEECTISLNVVSNDPTTVGGLVIKDIQIEKGSTAHSYAPYSNICPISGRNSVEAVDCGKNLYNGTLEQGTFTNQGVESQSASRVRTKYVLVDSGSVAISTPTSNVYIHEVYCYDKDNTFISRLSSGVGASSGVVTVPSGAKYIRFSLRHPDNSSISPSDDISIQVELNSSATAYEAFTSQSYTTTLPSTVYGGSDELVSGVGSDEFERINMGSLSWSYSGTPRYWYAVVNGIDTNVNSGQANTIMCECYDVTDTIIGPNSLTDGQITQAYGAYSHLVEFRDSRFESSTSAQVQSALDGLYLLYKKATPTPFTTTPTQVQTLLGTNNIFSTSGDVSVEYVADIQGYVDKKL